MKSLAVIALLLAACSSPARPVTQPPAPPSGGDGSGSAVDGADAKCVEPRPSPDAVCLQDCGPPVARDGDPEPAWRWGTPEQVANREQFGCPRCLPGDARIATPAGEVAMRSLVVGAIVWSTDEAGRRIAVPVVRVGSVRVPGDHVVVALVLADGREIIASPGHPTADARALGTLAVGDVLDGSTVVAVTRQPYRADRTYDLVPGSPTRTYWANGVLLASTLR